VDNPLVGPFIFNRHQSIAGGVHRQYGMVSWPLKIMLLVR
jgi:hypothetical protein